MIWLHVLHGAPEADWNVTKINPGGALPFLGHLAEARDVLEANADSEELADFLLDHAEEQGLSLQHVMAGRGSPGFASLLLAQLDAPTQEAMLPCSVQKDMVDWPLIDESGFHGQLIDRQATWTATSCMARCARHDHCAAYIHEPPRKDSELPGRPAPPVSRTGACLPYPHSTHVHRTASTLQARGTLSLASTAHRSVAPSQLLAQEGARHQQLRESQQLAPIDGEPGAFPLSFSGAGAGV